MVQNLVVYSVVSITLLFVRTILHKHELQDCSEIKNEFGQAEIKAPERFDYISIKSTGRQAMKIRFCIDQGS